MKTAREIIAETLERDWNLQGDACNEPRADAILASLAAEGFSIVETGRDPGADLAFHIGQLRHAYVHLSTGRVVRQKELADGIIAPAIRFLEGKT